MLSNWQLPSPRKVLIWGGVTVFLFFIYTIRGYLFAALNPFIAAILLTYLLEPFVSTLEKKKVPRIVAILVMYALVACLIAMFGIFVIPTIVEEVNGLIKQLPTFFATIQETIWELQDQYSRINLPPSVTETINNNLISLQNYLISLLNGVPQLIFGLVGQIFSLVLIPILAFYMLKDLAHIKRGLVRLIPSSRRSRLVGLFGRIDDTFGAWIRGQLTICFLVGFLTAIAMEIVGMDFSLMLGTIAGLVDVIPYFGPFIGAAPAVVLALLRSPALAIKVVIAFVVVQQIESNILSPQILGDRLGLHPLIIIFSLMLGAQFGGLLGMIFAAPMAAVIKVVIEFCADRVVA